MPGTFSHGYALLIGVGKCINPNWSLPVTVKDMKALRSVLVDSDMCGYYDDESHVCLLNDASATRLGILDGLRWLADQTAADKESTAIVFYSGHGGRKENTDSYYMLPSDTDPSDLESSALNGKHFTEALRSIKAKRLLVFMDCCQAGGMATAKGEQKIDFPLGYSKEAIPKDFAEQLKQGGGRAVFSSSTSSQRSWVRPDGKLSIYTYHLIEALYGAGNKPGDTAVHLSNLMNHLGKSVPKSVLAAYKVEQTPFFDTSTEDFPIGLLRGGKGLSSADLRMSQTEFEGKIDHILPAIDNSGSRQNTGQFPRVIHSFKNPFTPLNGRITDLANIYDREREVRDALEILQGGSSVVLLGDLGSGRSSMLTLLLDRVSKDLGWETVYMDMQMVADENGFYDELCKKLGIACSRGYILSHNLKNRGRRILLALDEVDKMAWDGFTRNIRSELRGLTEGDDAPLKLALAASTPLDRLFQDSEGGTSPFAGICIQINVKAWSASIAREFILERLREVPLSFSESEMQQIFQASRGMPQQLMLQAFNLCRSKNG